MPCASWRAIANGLRTGFGDEWIRFGATREHIVDGLFSERTMALSTPYTRTTYKGNVTETQEELDAWVEKVHRAGIQVNCHANGDVAIDMYLTALERRIKALDAIPLLLTTYAYHNSDKFPFYGEALMQRCMAFRTLLDAGVHAAAGSEDPHTVKPDAIKDVAIVRTVVDGKTIFEA